MAVTTGTIKTAQKMPVLLLWLGKVSLKKVYIYIYKKKVYIARDINCE